MGEVGDWRGAFGEQLRADRLAAGLTQEELAESAALSVRTISDLERGRTSRPRSSTLRQIADALRPPTADGAAAGGDGGVLRLAQLPADLADFTGRREQVEQLAGLLAAAGGGAALGAVVVSAVAGAGGIGKSALAVHAAHQVAPGFADGQLHVNLRGSGSQPVAPGEALARFLRDLGTDPAAVPADPAERAARYRSLLAGRRMLIMLDDARDAAQVRPLLPGTAGCAVVVTSRNSLPGLESARLLDLDVLTGADALALFARIIGTGRAAAEPAAVREVLAACGGLPLAIRIAAARLNARPGWSIAALAGRLGDARRRLDELQAGDLAVRASFMVSYASVRPPGRAADVRTAAAGGAGEPGGLMPDRAFRMISLADGPDIGLPAAAALLGVPADDAEQALELLVDAHLLQSAAPGRYRFHDLLRVYAGERVQAEEDQAGRDQALRRMLSWYLHTATAAGRLITPSRTHIPPGPAEPGTTALAFTGYAGALAWLDAEHANLVAAVTQASQHGEHQIAWKLPTALFDLFNLRGHLGDWIVTHQAALTSARLLDDRYAEQKILNSLGGAYLMAARPEDAIDCLRQALVNLREMGDAPTQAIVQLNLGIALTELGRLDESQQALQEALTLSRQFGHHSAEGAALLGLGTICRRRGQLSEAVATFQEALDALREAQNPVTECDTLIEMSKTRLQLGQLDLAVHEATAAVQLARRAGHRYDEAQALAVLGQAQRDRGDPEQARKHWLDAIAIFTQIGHPQAAEVAADLDALEPHGAQDTAPYAGMQGSDRLTGGGADG